VRCAVVILALVVGCGDGPDTSVTPDASVVDATPDAPMFAACGEFGGAALTLPAHVTGMLAAADVQSPVQCAAVNAPYGIASSGPDTVVPLVGLVPGTAYVVQLRSGADLAFYVATGCSTMSGPAASECKLFVDASAGGEEVGRFTADSDTAYVIVDHYASATPANQRFELDVYVEACQDDTNCTGGPPVCFNGRCVECADSFDCPVVGMPRCESATNVCATGTDACTADDASEPANDGPSGAVVLTPDAGGAFTTTNQICSSPRTEADFFKFAADAGDAWDLTLTWTGTRDLDLEVFNATGQTFGLSFWEQPETMHLSYLPAGTYWIRVTDFSAVTTAPISYTLAGQRVTTTGCTTRADCAADYRNQIYRGDCVNGACVSITATDLGAGSPCDTEDDCSDDLACPDFYFVADADTRSVCAAYCTTDSNCTAMGADYVCTTYLATGNFCVQKCTSDAQCPSDPTSEPVTDPWYRLTCQVSSGRCIFQ
jgi:hypothetical protein